MAVANFFDKVLLGLSTVLKEHTQNELEHILASKCIGLFFDKNGACTSEGKATLDLVIRLTARLYPKLRIETTDKTGLKEELIQLAKEINPVIEIAESGHPEIVIVVGITKYETDAHVFYIGSNNWVVNFSSNLPVGSANSNNPFAAGVAACIGTANVFRSIFRTYLPHSDKDQDFSLSLLDYNISSDKNQLQVTDLDINETVLVGLGAVGNGVIWGFNRLEGLKGKLVIVDDQEISLSNLQRYVLATQAHKKMQKTDMVKQYLSSSELEVITKPIKWEAYISERGNWNIETILSSIDSAEDRIMIQGALPQRIFNAWTQSENLGISRHLNFNEEPCLCCLYYPTVPKLSRAQEVANNLNLSDEEPLIRGYLANSRSMDKELLQLICTKNNLQMEEFNQFIGQSIDIFYSEVVCGGVLLKSSNNKGQNIEVPSAFESAMAGILLAAELVKEKLGFHLSEQSTTTQFNLIRPISKYLNLPESKKEYCICNDLSYKTRYKEKWQQS